MAPSRLGRNLAHMRLAFASLAALNPHRHLTMGADMKTVAGAAALAAGLAAAQIAWAVPFHNGVTAPEVARVLQDKGYKAEVGVDDDGDPKVTSAAEGVKFTVFFYGCEHTSHCTSLTFQSGFHIEGGLTAEKMNAWNRDKRFLKGWLDKTNDPFGEMDVDAHDGFTSEALSSYIDTWDSYIGEFKTFIGY